MSVRKKISNSLLWLVVIVNFIAVMGILSITLYSFKNFPSKSAEKNPLLIQAEQIMLKEPTLDKNDDIVLSLLQEYVKYTNHSFELMKNLLLALVVILMLILILVVSQMYMWSRDRKKLNHWKESGFLCERLELLPANRIKINNIELELNKAQIDTLNMLVTQRLRGKLLHSLDMGDHGVQAIKRLREELGSKFMEKTLVKVRKREGYWVEVDCSNIHDSRLD